MISQKRAQQLRKNFKLLFWIKALINVKALQIVVVLFYVHRGLTLSQVFYLGVVWAVVNLIAEIPSSYMADKWGRKRTLFIGVLAMLVNSIVYLFAHSFGTFVFGFLFFAFSFACFSGTDEALLYDSKKELGEEFDSLDTLAKYSSALQLFKIITPLVGALIAKDLLENQYLLLIGINIITGIFALILVLSLTEPYHYMDLEKREKGIVHDALKVLRSDWTLIKLILNKTIIFIASFLLWRYHQKFFVDMGVSILILGIGWSLVHLMLFFIKRNISKLLSSNTLYQGINFLNYIFVVSIIVFLVVYYVAPNSYLLLILFFVIAESETIRWPIFSEIFNKKSLSHNRATTLSFLNLLKSIFDIPLLFIAALLVHYGMIYPYFFALALGLLVVITFRLPKQVH